jgi:hypothetical protein
MATNREKKVTLVNKAKSLSGVASFAILALAATLQPAAATTALVTFDPGQGFAQGPSTYVAAGAQQTLTTTPATFTGGVILGFATFFPAIAYATAPNVYGTADFGAGLSKLLSINVNSGFATNEVSFALFNGETFAQSYEAIAYNGSSVVAKQTLSNLAANFNAGWGTVDLKASNITNVTISAVGQPNVFDFLIDTVSFNQSISTAVLPTPVTAPPTVFTPPPPVQIVDPNTEKEVEVDLNYGDNQGYDSLRSLRNKPVITTVPELSTWAMMFVGFAGLGFAGYRRNKAVSVAA